MVVLEILRGPLINVGGPVDVGDVDLERIGHVPMGMRLGMLKLDTTQERFQFSVHVGSTCAVAVLKTPSCRCPENPAVGG
jgi:hypothetical protein